MSRAVIRKCLVLTACILPVAAAAESLTLTDSAFEVPAGGAAEYLEDPGGSLTIKDITTAQNWQKPEGSSLHFKRTRSVLWLRVAAKTESRRNWVLAFAYPTLDQVSLFSKDNKGEFREERLGRLIPFSARQIRQRAFVFPVTLTPEPQHFYIRVQTESAMRCAFSFWQADVLYERLAREEFYLGIYSGLMLIMAFYNFFLFLTIQDRAYLHYFFYVISFAVFQMSLDGMVLKYLLPELPALAKALVPVSAAASCALAMLFAVKFLDLRTNAPGLRRAALVVAGVSTAIGISGLLDHSFGVRAIGALAFPAAFLVLLAGVRAYRRGFTPAKYFLAAWSALILITMVLSAQTMGFVPPTFLVEQGQKFATGLEVLLLSMALADRYSLMQKNLLDREHEAFLLGRKLAEQQNMAALGSMAAGIVHDFKNPVSVILGYAELAHDDSIQHSERRDYLAIISQEANRLASMAQDVMDYSRGSISTQKRFIQLGEFLSRAERSLKPYFAPGKTAFEVIQKSDGKLFVDPERFLRVLVNIAGNAADVLGADGRFEIIARRTQKAHVFELRDNGPGIPVSIRERLFEPFVTLGKTHGTGLGMAISKSIVEAHDGMIRFETGDGGTTFLIEIPAVEE